MPTDSSLMLAPTPIAGESPSSWLHRLSLLHGRGAQTLLHSVGIRKMKDPDITLTSQQFGSLVRETNVNASMVAHLGTIYEPLRESRYRRLLRHDDRGRPVYAFCPECLASDETPYLRIAWRFTHWDICPTHRIRMCYRCLGCEAPLLAMRPPQKFYLADLRRCSMCASDLTLQSADRLPQEEICGSLRIQAALANTLLLGHCFIEGHPERVPLDFLMHALSTRQLDGTGIRDTPLTPQFRLLCHDGQMFFLFLNFLGTRGESFPDVT
ncbi:TniQ family protein [Paraburkholderia terricola]|uniref:TniQ family protein n=1 Tax=Paraburkholderia terricola TaxID=169427 RepID=UPI003ECD4BE2